MKKTKITIVAALLALVSFTYAALAAASSVWVAGAEKEMNAFYGFSAADPDIADHYFSGHICPLNALRLYG